jgi:hypothetical protein
LGQLSEIPRNFTEVSSVQRTYSSIQQFRIGVDLRRGSPGSYDWLDGRQIAHRRSRPQNLDQLDEKHPDIIGRQEPHPREHLRQRQQQRAGTVIILHQREEQAASHVEHLILGLRALGRLQNQILAIAPVQPQAPTRASLQLGHGRLRLLDELGERDLDRRHAPTFTTDI